MLSQCWVETFLWTQILSNALQQQSSPSGLEARRRMHLMQPIHCNHQCHSSRSSFSETPIACNANMRIYGKFHLLKPTQSPMLFLLPAWRAWFRYLSIDAGEGSCQSDMSVASRFHPFRVPNLCPLIFSSGQSLTPWHALTL